MSGARERVAETQAGTLKIEKLLLKPEAGIAIPVRILADASGGSRGVVVYLRDRAGESDRPDFFEMLARKRYTVVVADVRGFGETMSPRNVPDTRMYYYHPRDGMDADYAYAAMSLGRPLAGMRVEDALAVIQMGRSVNAAAPLTLVGRGWAGLIGLFCAAVETSVNRLAIEGLPASYAEVAGSELYAQPASLVVPGALEDFDIVDVVAALAPRPVLVMNLEDAQTRKMPSESAAAAMLRARENYQSAGAASAYALRTAVTEPEVWDALAEWI